MDVEEVLTHALLIQSIQLQTCTARGLLRACPNLIDCVKSMAKNSVCDITCASVSYFASILCAWHVRVGADSPTESDMIGVYCRRSGACGEECSE